MKLGKLALAMGLLGLTLSQSVLADVSGTVYRDLPVNGSTLNTYGVKDTNELGVTGITVTATGTTGSGTATTAADGSWNVAGSLGDVRVEFSNVPDYLESSPVSVGSNTTVQFISDGGMADIGLHNPADYSDSANPTVSLPRHQNGVASSANTGVGIGSFAYDSTGLDSTYTASNGNPGTGPNAVNDATVAEVGAVWGAAWQSDKNRLFAGSFLKRHVGMASSPSSVFVLNHDTSPATLVKTFDLQGISPANGGTAIDLGSVCRRSATDGDLDSNCDPLTTGLATDYELGDPNTTHSVDLDSFAKIAKMSFGDIDMQESTPVLWLVNLNQKSLISVDVSGDSASLPGAVNQYPLSSMSGLPACTGGELRPWGLGFNDGRGYMGVVCDANTSDVSNLHAYTLSFDPNDMGSGFNQEIDFSLDYARKDGGSASVKWDFAPWSDDWAVIEAHSDPDKPRYAQPVFSNIEFDRKGNMYIELFDRLGHQFSTRNYLPISGNTISNKKGHTGGDIIRVCRVGSTWELEGDANCPVAYRSDTDGVNGSGEHFNDLGAGPSEDSVIGSMAILKGSDQVITTVMDPHPEAYTDREEYWNTEGVNTLNITTGEIDNWYGLTFGNGLPYFGKVHSLGDLELLTAPAPLEIGNRIWDDTNSNGVQDAGEAGLDGVDVTLNCGASDFTQTTASGGQYLFTDTNVAGGIPRNTTCTITVPTTTAGKSLTTQTAVVDEALGSNPDASNGSFSFITGRSGQNNHTYDIGYRDAPACSIIAAALPSACTNVGSDSDTSNDTFDLSVTVEGSNTGASTTYSYTSNSANISGGGIYSATAETDGSFVIEATTSPFNLVITDSVNATCSITVSNITAPAVCSNSSQVDLSIEKTVSPASAVSGDTVTYTITVANGGPDDATGVVVTDLLPAGVTYANNFTATQGAYVAGTGIWTVGALANTATATLTIDVTVD